MTSRDLVFLFGLNHAVFRENAAGLTHEESLRTPETGGNCLNWCWATCWPRAIRS